MRSTALSILTLIFAGIVAACGDTGGRIVDPRANVVTPACAQPAPLLGQPDSRVADSYIVVYRGDVDVQATTERLEQRYAFTATHVYTSAIKGFSASFPAEVLAGIRCEAVVAYTEHDQVVTAQ